MFFFSHKVCMYLKDAHSVKLALNMQFDNLWWSRITLLMLLLCKCWLPTLTYEINKILKLPPPLPHIWFICTSRAKGTWMRNELNLAVVASFWYPGTAGLQEATFWLGLCCQTSLGLPLKNREATANYFELAESNFGVYDKKRQLHCMSTCPCKDFI